MLGMKTQINEKTAGNTRTFKFKCKKKKNVTQ